ncbi:hypothetical protein [Bradyrhizobium sp. SZCCHNRI3043]|uniref:hypothetical protein n=1 Tax=Bradyrhizobium sp. SZCCHNRI3043 TaxID=3057292 RepID=UPI0028E1CEAA|nr:hypothetical protein [Bradyrhizobium sp. SZCCHNRI3043]
MVKLTVSYGYDIHSIELDDATYAAIKSGQKVALDGQGFVHEEEGKVLDHWVFNNTPGDIYFWLDSGAEFRARDSWIEDAS